MSLYESILRPILFALSKSDNEEAHLLAIKAMRGIQRVPPLLALIAMWNGRTPSRPVTVAGINFPNRIGLAAGFDKQGEVLAFMEGLGFGFVEIGTVLPQYQKGNPRPRMFRLPEVEDLINRMGFNSDGALTVAKRLAGAEPRVRIPIGVSLGKMKETPLEEAARDYVKALNLIGRYGRYWAINVSSPNTPELRRLQGKAYLESLVGAVVQAEHVHGLHFLHEPRPVFVKLAPDLSEAEVDESVGAAENGGARGLIIRNTTTERERAVREAYPELGKEVGGYSGPDPWRTIKIIELVRKRSKLPVIAVGGITSPGVARLAIEEGADLVQIFTGFVYQGPKLLHDLRRVI